MYLISQTLMFPVACLSVQNVMYWSVSLFSDEILLLILLMTKQLYTA